MCTFRSGIAASEAIYSTRRLVQPIIATCAPVRLRPQGWLPWSDSRGVAGVAAQVEAESQLPEVLMTHVHTMGKMAQWFALADADVALYAAKVTVWGRWIVWFFAAVLLAYRPGLWYPEDIGYALLNVMLATLNGVFHYRLLTNRPVTWRWMVGLSAMDIALITANIAVSGRFDNYIFLTYYPALGAIAVIFTSFRLNMAWATAAAAAHTAVSLGVGSGLDLDAGDERALAARVAAMYLIVVGVNLIVRFERIRRQAAMAGERQAQQERIELSQAIHDTTAQTAYMIGLGIDGAMKLAGDSNPKLTERLAATAALSKSAMWELRRPIDMGRIFEGRDLARVLGSHTATFAKITSVPAGMVQSGEEPQLTTGVRTGLFSIAHNALANAFLHAQAGRVEVRLDFQARRHTPVRLRRWGGPTGGLRRAGPRLQRHGARGGANGRPACRGNGRPGRGDDHRLLGPPCGSPWVICKRRLRCHRPIGSG